MAFAPSLVAPLLPPPHAAATWGRRTRATPPRLVLAASSRGGDPAPPTFERLREQLLQLHAEADLTQSKANSARVRLVRLTEAAENLKKRAVVSVRLGRENEAVDLLVQKKKLTKALENIKERIEVLDNLSAKISEAISMKQNMLIEHALRPGMPNGEESNDEIRVFSSKVDDGAGETSGSLSKSGEKGSFQMKNVVYSNMASQSEQSELQLADRFTLSNDHGPTNSINNRSAYDDFIEHIDSQLNSLEYELEQLVSSQLAQEVDIQQPRNGKWHKLRDILKLLTETRKRIANILDNTGASLIDVNIEGEERTRWKFGVDTLLVFSLVGGGQLGVLELALPLLFGRKEVAHLFGTSQDFLLSCLEEYLWSWWTKGSRGSSMEDIFELGFISLQLAVLGLAYHHFISMVVHAKTLTMEVVALRQSARDVHFPGLSGMKRS